MKSFFASALLGVAYADMAEYVISEQGALWTDDDDDMCQSGEEQSPIDLPSDYASTTVIPFGFSWSDHDEWDPQADFTDETDFTWTDA